MSDDDRNDEWMDNWRERMAKLYTKAKVKRNNGATTTCTTNVITKYRPLLPKPAQDSAKDPLLKNSNKSDNNEDKPSTSNSTNQTPNTSRKANTDANDSIKDDDNKPYGVKRNRPLTVHSLLIQRLSQTAVNSSSNVNVKATGTSLVSTSNDNNNKATTAQKTKFASRTLKSRTTETHHQQDVKYQSNLKKLRPLLPKPTTTSPIDNTSVSASIASNSSQPNTSCNTAKTQNN